MAPSIWQIMIVVILLVLLFGRDTIAAGMGDVAKGIKSFKKGMNADPDLDKVEAVAEQTIDVTPDAKKDQA